LSRSPGAPTECHWCKQHLLYTTLETIEHRFYDCPLTSHIWLWVEKTVFPKVASIYFPYLSYSRTSGDVSNSAIKWPAALLKPWSIIHASTCHHLFTLTREKKIKTTTAPKTRAKIKARILTDLEDTIRAEWFKTANTHRAILKFKTSWQDFYPSQVKIMNGATEYNFSEETENTNAPKIIINIRTQQQPPQPPPQPRPRATSSTTTTTTAAAATAAAATLPWSSRSTSLLRDLNLEPFGF